MMSGRILILLAGPLLVAVVALIVQRRSPHAGAIIGGVTSLLLTVPATVGAADQAIQLFDGALSLTGPATWTLRALYGGAALLLFLSARWPQGPAFVPAGLAALSPLAATMIAQSFPLGVVTLLAATALLAAMIQAGRRGATLASFRYLTVTALALPFFLVAAWMLGSEQAVFTGSVWRLLLVGAALVLAGFPFHIWVRPVAENAPPLITVFAFTLAPAGTLVLLFSLLQQYPVIQGTPFPTFLRWSGAAAAITGGLLAPNAPTLKSLWGSLLLVEMGSAVMILAAGPAGQQAALTGLGLRFAGLLLTALGLILLGSGRSDRALDSTRQNRWGWGLFAYGALSLIGLPLTPGFPARWAAISAAATESPWLVLLLLVAMASAAAGLLRRLASVTRQTVSDQSHLAA